jgi:hypothetical protein
MQTDCFIILYYFLIDEDVLNKITCFQVNGSKVELVDVQHTIPDINSFEVFHQLLLFDYVIDSFSFARI